jgi:glutamine amidotransferase
MIAIVDYGAGNLRSVAKAFEHLGYQPTVTQRRDDLAAATAVVLPGVGAAADTMRNLAARDLVAPIKEAIHSGKPFFGVCMGLQALLEDSEEGGGQRCMGIIPGTVCRLPAGLKVPHMGWNQVRQRRAHALFEGIPDGSNFYFVHSYYVAPEEAGVIAGDTEYGVTFCSVLIRDNLVATQFHPEKSGAPGLRLYDNFARLAGLRPARQRAARTG